LIDSRQEYLPQRTQRNPNMPLCPPWLIFLGRCRHPYRRVPTN
jgi:hypothetical protein